VALLDLPGVVEVHSAAMSSPWRRAFGGLADLEHIVRVRRMDWRHDPAMPSGGRRRPICPPAILRLLDIRPYIRSHGAKWITITMARQAAAGQLPGHLRNLSGVDPGTLEVIQILREEFNPGSRLKFGIGEENRGREPECARLRHALADRRWVIDHVSAFLFASFAVPYGWGRSTAESCMKLAKWHERAVHARALWRAGAADEINRLKREKNAAILTHYCT
jgi:hypothetical protein